LEVSTVNVVDAIVQAILRHARLSTTMDRALGS
jgi:hypothetical protein